MQLYDYYPFGTQLEDASYGDSEVEVKHSFTDKEFEEELGLYYFEARWYDSEIGKFGSVDPAQYSYKSNVFTQSNLQDPQLFNAYSYSRNNPLLYKDPTGLWAGIDNLIAAAAGATVGLVGQIIEDVASGEMSGWQEYTGAVVGGAVAGEVTLHAGPVAGAAAGAAVDNAVTQSLEILTGESDGFDATSFVTDVAVETATSFIPGPDIPGVTSGKGSYSSVSSQITTKLDNGTISNISAETAGKMYTADVVESSTGELAEAATATVTNKMSDD